MQNSMRRSNYLTFPAGRLDRSLHGRMPCITLPLPLAFGLRHRRFPPP